MPHEYFPTCLKACHYCSVLHAKIAARSRERAHLFAAIAHETTSLAQTNQRTRQCVGNLGINNVWGISKGLNSSKLAV